MEVGGGRYRKQQRGEFYDCRASSWPTSGGGDGSWRGRVRGEEYNILVLQFRHASAA